MTRYFNYRFHIAEGSWQRRDFVRQWRHIYQSDDRWVPPFYPDLAQWLDVTRNAHLARMDPILLYGEALPQRKQPRSPHRTDLPAFSGAVFEESVVAGVLLRDRRRRDGAVYVAALHLANDDECLSRFLAQAQELLQPQGVRRLILPTGLSPHLGSGILQDHFHRLPPLHSAYNPPYLPEVAALVCRPLGRALLYEVVLPTQVANPQDGLAVVESFDPRRLAGDLLPLFAQTMPQWADFPAPDEVEADFLLSRLMRFPLRGWLATVAGEAVGYVLLQPDFAAALQRADGGRTPWWRLWLNWRMQQPVASGRLIFGGVLPPWRRQGIGGQLWRMAQQGAVNDGWRTLSIGPMPSTATGNLFLEAQGIAVQRTYLLHSYDF